VLGYNLDDKLETNSSEPPTTGTPRLATGDSGLAICMH
jgi:hypothetical protein